MSRFSPVSGRPSLGLPDSIPTNDSGVVTLASSRVGGGDSKPGLIEIIGAAIHSKQVQVIGVVQTGVGYGKTVNSILVDRPLSLAGRSATAFSILRGIGTGHYIRQYGRA